MKQIYDFYIKYKTQINAIIVAVGALIAAIWGGYEVGQNNPDPPAVMTAVAESPAILDEIDRPRKTATPPGRNTPPPKVTPTITATATKVVPTATDTATPSLTHTATVGVTLTVTPSPTTIVVGHDVTTWHAPGVAFHHHGWFWQDVFSEIVAWMETHPWGPLFSSVGTLWGSSPIENLWPWPLGKHEGFVNLAELNTGCPQFDPGGMFAHGNCINAYYFQVHALGNAEEFFARVHSDKGVFWVCDKAGVKCDIVATGGVTDYGERHNAYKKDICLIPGIPVYDANDSLDQPPYLSVNGSKRQFQFWSSLLNASMEPFFAPDVPNRLLQVAWNNRPFSVTAANTEAEPNLCADLGSKINHTNLENRNNQFQVFSLLLYIEDFPRPFEGFTDLHGNMDATCTAPSPTCVPLYIGPNVPAGNATLNRPVLQGDPEAAPIQIFGAEATLLPPGSIVP